VVTFVFYIPNFIHYQFYLAYHSLSRPNMRILLCLNKDIYCISAFNFLLPHIKNHQICIYFSSGVGDVPDNEHLKSLLDCEQDLSMNNIEMIASKSGVEFGLESFLTFKQIEQDFKIFKFNNINKDGAEYLSEKWKPDLIISIRFGQIFKAPIIALPKFGIINLHSGILPDYKGILATFWAMMNGESDIGTTLHFVNDSSIDTGNIISISKCNADYQQSLIVNVFKLYQSGVKMIVDVIQKMNSNLNIENTKQDKLLGCYFSYPNDKNVMDFLKLGLNLT